MAPKHTGQVAAEATANKKKATPAPHGTRAPAAANMPTPMPHVGMPGCSGKEAAHATRLSKWL
jgi:hypothetical protein